jgi:hypothetical protein
MESRLLERRLLFTMLGAISSSCRVSLLRYICLNLFANFYLDYQVSLVLILPSVKLTKYLVFVHKTIHVTLLVREATIIHFGLNLRPRRSRGFAPASTVFRSIRTLGIS